MFLILRWIGQAMYGRDRFNDLEKRATSNKRPRRRPLTRRSRRR